MDMTTQVLKIMEWADEKGIGKDGYVETQLTKSTEENAELQHAIAKNAVNRKITGIEITDSNLLDIKDALGDIFVTLVTTIYAKLKDKDAVLKVFRKACKENYALYHMSWIRIIVDSKSLDSKFFMSVYNFGNDIETTLHTYVKFLRQVAYSYNVYLADCVDLAYNTIKNRKGKTVNGEFVKD